MKLGTQGFFKEMLQGNENDPSILNFIQTDASENEEKIVNYLEKGTVIIACGGVVCDIINPENGLAGCPELMTDGKWVWPGELAYYVKNYHIKLSLEFINTMIDNGWQVEYELPENLEDIEFINSEFYN